MKPQINDTSAHIQALLIAGYRRLTPRQKMRQVSELNKIVQQFALARTENSMKVFSAGAEVSFNRALALG